MDFLCDYFIDIGRILRISRTAITIWSKRCICKYDMGLWIPNKHRQITTKADYGKTYNFFKVKRNLFVVPVSSMKWPLKPWGVGVINLKKIEAKLMANYITKNFDDWNQWPKTAKSFGIYSSDQPKIWFGRTSTLLFGPYDRTFFCRTQNFFLCYTILGFSKRLP